MHDFFFPATQCTYPLGESASLWPSFFVIALPFIVIAIIWTLVIKGYALWHAAQNKQKGWFVALLFINTLGILEVIYLIWFRPTSPHAPPTVSSVSEVH